MAGSIALTDSDSSTANASSYTFTSKSVGTAATDRVVFVCVETRGTGTTIDFAASSPVTIAGSDATLVIKRRNVLDGANTNIAAIWKLALASGTTATVAVALTGTALRCAVQVFAATGIDATVAYDSDFGETLGTTSPSLSIDVPAGGVLLACGIAAANTTTTWTGPTERTDTVVEANTTCTSASDNYASAQAGYTVASTFAAVGASAEPTLVAAAFGPSGGGALVPLLTNNAFMAA